MPPKLLLIANGYITSTQVILAITSLSKLISAGGKARVLAVSDPLFGVPNRDVLLCAGLVELAAVAYLHFGKDIRAKWLRLLWLSSVFILYRIGVWWTGAAKPCPCLGTLLDAIPLSTNTINGIFKVIIGYMFLGSLFFLTYVSMKKKQPKIVTI